MKDKVFHFRAHYVGHKPRDQRVRRERRLRILRNVGSLIQECPLFCQGDRGAVLRKWGVR